MWGEGAPLPPKPHPFPNDLFLGEGSGIRDTPQKNKLSA